MEWKEVGKRIKALRKERNLTQEQFGKLISKSKQYIGRMERGQKLSVDIIVAICKETGTSMDYIILGIADPMDDAHLIKDFSKEQIEIGFDILKSFAEFVRSKNGNTLLIKEVMRRQTQSNSD